jgi:outer membrane protein assembly factor BamB
VPRSFEALRARVRSAVAFGLAVGALIVAPSALALPSEVAAGVAACANLNELPLAFRFGTGATPAAAPTVAADGSVYVGTREGYLHALSADGSYLWGYTLKGAVTGRAAVGPSGTVLVPTARRIYAIRADGTLLWVWSSPIRVLGDLIRDGLGRFNFASDDGRVFALSGTGALVAHVPGRVPFSVLPVALADGGIAAGRQDGSVLISRGFKTKRVELGAVPVSLFPCPGRELCAISAGNLQGLGPSAAPWRVPALRATASSDSVAVLSDERHLQLYRGATGEPLFTLALPDAASAAPEFDAKGRIFVPLRGGALLAVDLTGAPLACTQLGHSPLGTPVVDAARGRVLVTASEGILASVELP